MKRNMKSSREIPLRCSVQFILSFSITVIFYISSSHVAQSRHWSWHTFTHTSRRVFCSYNQITYNSVCSLRRNCKYKADGDDDVYYKMTINYEQKGIRDAITAYVLPYDSQCPSGLSSPFVHYEENSNWVLTVTSKERGNCTLFFSWQRTTRMRPFLQKFLDQPIKKFPPLWNSKTRHHHVGRSSPVNSTSVHIFTFYFFAITLTLENYTKKWKENLNTLTAVLKNTFLF